jgi:hypothetical protein
MTPFDVVNAVVLDKNAITWCNKAGRTFILPDGVVVQSEFVRGVRGCGDCHFNDRMCRSKNLFCQLDDGTVDSGIIFTKVKDANTI